MQFTSAIALLAAFAGLSTAAPSSQVQARAVATTGWTIKDFTRTCDKADTKCTYSFGIATPSGTTACKYDVTGKPASRTSVKPLQCGAFQVSSNWDGQFGEGNGFTTFAVTNHKQIAWPAYADKELTNGKAFKPDLVVAVHDL